MNLKKELKKIHTQFLKDASPEAKRILNNAAEKLAHQNLKRGKPIIEKLPKPIKGK